MALFNFFIFILSIIFVEGGLHPRIQIQENLNKNNFGRIIDGLPASSGQFPHQVNLILFTSSGSGALCGGSLISTSHVLTAAHCLFGREVVYVRIGTTDLSSGIVVESRNFTIHSRYNPLTLYNDLGLITLPSPVEVTDLVKPIRLPRKSDIDETHEEKISTVSGWGYTTNDGPVSEDLNYVNLKVISNSECSRDYTPLIIIASTICCVGLEAPSQSTCSGDSGGPLIINDSDGEITQIGVVSFVSARGCDSGHPSGYVRTGHFLDWINEITGLTMRP